MAGQRTVNSIAAAVVLAALAVVGAAALLGWVVGHETRPAAAVPVPTAIEASSPPGHTGTGLPPGAFGNPARGARLFVSKGCADCHSYGDRGGTDAPPLDFMKGHLSAREIANMSGRIWNHLPAMLHHFEEEGIPFPTFQAFEMADLIAFLHSGAGSVVPRPSAHEE